MRIPSGSVVMSLEERYRKADAGEVTVIKLNGFNFGLSARMLDFLRAEDRSPGASLHNFPHLLAWLSSVMHYMF